MMAAKPMHFALLCIAINQRPLSVTSAMLRQQKPSGRASLQHVGIDLKRWCVKTRRNIAEAKNEALSELVSWPTLEVWRWATT